ncbi:uncharacterized protein [Musca autumnalis]|uniref:uncharacterized protein n=1 Tax=Musca autumnalis TaxID=221902 RepID=UPI003CF95B48
MSQTPCRDIQQEFGLRIRLHVLNCDEEFYKPIQRSESPADYMKVALPLGFYAVDYFAETQQQIYNRLETGEYIGYASLLILLNSPVKGLEGMLQKVITKLRENPFLRYKTKLILLNYDLHNNFVFSRECFEHLKTHSPEGISSANLEVGGGGGANPNNTLLWQYFQNKDVYHSGNLLRLLNEIAVNPRKSLWELNTKSSRFEYVLYGSSSNADNYFYSINPALAIIINNYYFTSAKRVRQGSEADMRRLIKELKIAQIPFIVIQDCSRQEYLRILEYIKHCNFHPLKTFMLFFMSHGDSGNVIYTSDGQLHLFEQIIAPLEANESLANVEKLVVGNFCRGRIDYEYATYRDLKSIKDTQCHIQLRDRTTLMFSVPDGVASPRHPQTGSPFMEIFCETFRSIDHNEDLRKVHQVLEQRLHSGGGYYDGVPKCSDIVMGNPNINHNFLRSRYEADEMIALIQKLREDFPKLLDQGGDEEAAAVEEGDGRQNQHPKSLFYICGAVKKVMESSNLNKHYFIEKYFGKELDED